MLVTLASMIGQIGLPGGGFGLSYHYCSGGEPTSSDPGLTGISATPGSGGKSSLTPRLEHSPLAIPVARVTDMLANPGKTIDYNGKRIKYPDIKLVYWADGNPFGHQEERNKLITTWHKPQTIVVQDFFGTATAKCNEPSRRRRGCHRRDRRKGQGSSVARRAVARSGLVRSAYYDRGRVRGRTGSRQGHARGNARALRLSLRCDAAGEAMCVRKSRNNFGRSPARESGSRIRRLRGARARGCATPRWARSCRSR
jgi:hypothetical protein